MKSSKERKRKSKAESFVHAVRERLWDGRFVGAIFARLNIGLNVSGSLKTL